MYSMRSTLVIGTSILAFASACSKGEQERGDSSAGATAAPMASGDTAMAGMDHSKMAGDSMAGMNMAMTGDADRDFLRMMIDHHAAMIAMAQDATSGGKASASRTDAQSADSKQTAELKQMQAMLQKQFQDGYQPRVMPDNQQMLNDLKAKSSGKEYDRAFYQHTVMHHQQAVKMVDEYLPKAKNAELKAMAQKMKADQTREIAEFEQKAASLQ